MTNALDAIWREGLDELAVCTPADGARVRVQARVVRRRRRRRAIGASVTSVWLLAGLFTISALTDDDKQRPIQVGPGTETPTSPLTTSSDEPAPTTPTPTPTVTPSTAPKRPESGAAKPSAAKVKVPPRVPAVATPRRNPSGASRPPAGPSATVAPPTSAAPTAGGSTPEPARPTTTTTPSPLIEEIPPLEFPGADSTHLFVVLDDDGYHASASRMDAGTFQVSFLDARTLSSTNTILKSWTLTPSAKTPYITVRTGHTKTMTMRTIEDYALSAFDGDAQVRGVVPLSIVVPAGRGTTTEPSDEVTIDITAEGRYVFPFRDNIDDAVEPRIINNDPLRPIAHVAPGPATLRIRNQTDAAYQLVVERYWSSDSTVWRVTIEANATATLPVDFAAGAWYDLRADTGNGEWIVFPDAFLVVE